MFISQQPQRACCYVYEHKKRCTNRCEADGEAIAEPVLHKNQDKLMKQKDTNGANPKIITKIREFLAQKFKNHPKDYAIEVSVLEAFMKNELRSERELKPESEQKETKKKKGRSVNYNTHLLFFQKNQTDFSCLVLIQLVKQLWRM
jgi:hypothetical protein